MAWRFDGCISMQNLDIVRGDNRIAMIDCDNEALCDDDILANARLMLAAPVMLAALGALVWQLDRMDDLPEELEIMVVEAKAAIAQAKGEA